MINNYFISNYNFTSRNFEIRKADNLCRELKQRLPVQSPSKLFKFNKINNYAPLRRLDRQLSTNRKIFDNATSDIDYYKRLIAMTLKTNVANCGELGRLYNAFFAIKGYKDCYLADLYHFIPSITESYDLDHSVLVLGSANKRKIIIVDPWSGFCDDIDNAKVRFKTEFANLLNFAYEPDYGKIIFKKNDRRVFPQYGKDILAKEFEKLNIRV